MFAPPAFPPMAPQMPELIAPLEDDALEMPEPPPQPTSETDFSPEERELLGEYCARVFSDSTVVRDADREHVWRRNRDDYANKAIPFVSQFNKDARDIPVNMASTKADSLRDMVTGALFGTMPYATVKAQGMPGEEVGKLEKLMQTILEDTCIEERVKESHEDVWCTNHAIFRICWDPATLRYVIDTIDPECFVVAGGDRFGIEESVLVGHSYWARREDVLYDIEQKVFYEYPDGATERVSDADPLEEVNLAQLFVKCDHEVLKRDKRVRPVKDWYLVTLDIDAKHILKVELFTLADRPWYFSAAYMPSKRKGGYWSKHSLGAFMQGPHCAHNVLFNIAAYGAAGRAFPPVYVEGELTNGTDQPTWGSQVPTYGGHVTAPYQQFDPSNLELIMARTERIGDGVARVSQVASGQTFNKGMTATEAQLIAQGTDQGVSGYVSTYAIAVEEMVSYIYKTLRYTHSAVLQRLDESLRPVDPATTFWRDDIKWIAAGRGQFASPALRMAQLDKVNEMSLDPRLIGKFDVVEIAEMRLAVMNLPNKDRIFDPTRPTPPPPPGIPLGAGGPGPAPGTDQEPPAPGGPGGDSEVAGLAASYKGVAGP